MEPETTCTSQHCFCKVDGDGNPVCHWCGTVRVDPLFDAEQGANS